MTNIKIYQCLRTQKKRKETIHCQVKKACIPNGRTLITKHDYLPECHLKGHLWAEVQLLDLVAEQAMRSIAR